MRGPSYRKIAGFALMFFAAMVLSAHLGGAYDGQTKTLHITTGVVPLIVSHVHPEGEPDAPHGRWYSSEQLVVVPEDMWITSFRPLVENGPIDILHHVLLYEMGVQNRICPNTFTKVREWYAASMNTARDPVVFEEPYGVYFKKGTALAIEAMEHTVEKPQGPGSLYENVKIIVELTYVPAGKTVRRTKSLEFYRLRLDDSPCAFPMRHEAFAVPAGITAYVKTFDPHAEFDGGRYIFEESGEIIGFGSNFWPWKGGKEMRALVNGKQVASLRPEKLNDAWAWRIPQHNETVYIRAGDIIAAEMVYENPYEDKQIKDASGMLGFYFAERGARVDVLIHTASE